eukprot:6188873-Pleurochrysis_carterae.AAC.1
MHAVNARCECALWMHAFALWMCAHALRASALCCDLCVMHAYARAGAFLGIGHLHRGFRDSLRGLPLPRNLTYFGHHYTHFFYVVK